MLAYMGNCSDLNGFDLPYSVDARMYQTRYEDYCQVQYQAKDIPEWMLSYDQYRNERQYRSLIRQYPRERIQRLDYPLPGYPTY